MELTDLWLKTIAVIGLCVAGGVVGRWMGSLNQPYWPFGYLLSLCGLVFTGASRHFPDLNFLPLFAWLTEGRREYAVLGVSVAMLLMTLSPRLPGRGQKGLIVALALVAALKTAILPFLGPILVRSQMVSIETEIDAQGVCLQTSSYTCGPAAAVTVLRRFGIEADEGEIAIHAGTGPTTGTPADMLCRAIEELFAKEGIECRYRQFDSVAELKRPGVTIALVKLNFFMDHYVAVLRVADEYVVVADPLMGQRRLSHAAFKQRWRGSGIEILHVQSLLPKFSSQPMPEARATEQAGAGWGDRQGASKVGRGSKQKNDRLEELSRPFD